MLAFILSFALIFATTARANANTSVGGWTATDSLIAGANTTINATKTAGGKFLKSAITIAPQAGKVGKYLLRGAGVGALALAVPQLIGDSVDWVLDPANNRIKYIVPASDIVDPAVSEICPVGSSVVTPNEAVALCNSTYGSGCTWNASVKVVMWRANYIYTCDFVSSSPSVPVEKYIPIDVVAQKVIANAEAGHAPSQEAVKATALESFAAGEHDAALDAAAEADTGVENPPDTENPPKDPAEPFDPAGIISAINALKALLAGILSSITSLSDWFKSNPPPEPKPEDTEIDIPMPDLPTPDTDINFGGSCPANFEFNGSIFGNPINIVLLDTSKFCGFLSTFVKFPVYAASSLFALYILGGRKDG